MLTILKKNIIILHVAGFLDLPLALEKIDMSFKICIAWNISG